MTAALIKWPIIIRVVILTIHLTFPPQGCKRAATTLCSGQEGGKGHTIQTHWLELCYMATASTGEFGTNSQWLL